MSAAAVFSAEEVGKIRSRFDHLFRGDFDTGVSVREREGGEGGGEREREKERERLRECEKERYTRIIC